MKPHSQTIAITTAAVLLLASAAPSHARNNGPTMIKLTQYDKSTFCDLAVAPDGKLHAVFTDQPAYDKPIYLYYRSSTDDGKTWGEPVNLSDDESGNNAGYARVALDAKGRLYVVWKYVGSTLLDGPGAYANGRLVYRCNEGGTWSKRVPLGDAKVPTFSWFLALDAAGTAHVIWSQMAKDAAAAQPWGSADYADFVREATLDGGTAATIKDLIVPKPLLTKAEQDAMKAAHRYPKYEDTVPQKAGLYNLRGFVDAGGKAHFVAENPGPLDQSTGRQLLLWDGAQLTTLYAFEKYKTYNNFNNPPALLLDGVGKQHFIRAPEKSEKPCVRDYPVEGTALGDFTDIITPKRGPGFLANWQAHQLPGGRMAVTVALSEKGGYDPDDVQLLVSFSDGGGKWSEPMVVANTRDKKGDFVKETTPGNTIGALYKYKPRFASLALGKDGQPRLLVVNVEDTLVGVTSAGVTSSGRAVTGTGSLRVDNPAVFFVKF